MKQGIVTLIVLLNYLMVHTKVGRKQERAHVSKALSPTAAVKFRRKKKEFQTS